MGLLGLNGHQGYEWLLLATLMLGEGTDMRTCPQGYTGHHLVDKQHVPKELKLYYVTYGTFYEAAF